MPLSVPPTIGITVYPSRGMRATVRAVRPTLLRLSRAAAKDDLSVTIHDPVDGDEAPVLDLLEELGLRRVWFAWGANAQVRTARARGVAAALDELEEIARRIALLKPEAVEPNGERDGARPLTDWVIDKPGDENILNALAEGMMLRLRAALPGVPICITSHDRTWSHRLPWGKLAGPNGCDMLSLQYYDADTSTPEPEGIRSTRARVVRGLVDLRRHVEAGVIRQDLYRGEPGWVPYGQAHSKTSDGVAYLLDCADSSRVWALPARCDERGLAAIEAVLVARRECGRSRGSLVRFQEAERLKPDGVLGPKTMAAVQRRLRG